ncbi:hypothetical protein ACHHYP_15696 [Achlya hypogyna]|uniref:START domain-containing protein n=1 Tax=Achlya hypogyna TaxID=1202772 RepID=A0A1V9YA43_ACHHY|nr:hypothetical protein ACHHYP_15696 [Achlya hypogyna]
MNTPWQGLELTLEEVDILETIYPSASSSESDEMQRKRKHAAKLATQRTQRHRKKQQDELVYLKRKVHELQTHLQQLTLTQKLSDSTVCGKWEKLARDERKRHADVTQENKRLKEAIEEQVQFAECLVDIIKKRPRLTLLTDEAHDQWKLLKLVTDPDARASAFHAIPDREHAKLDSILIEAGLVDIAKGFRRALPKLQPSGDLEVQVCVCGRFDVPYNIVVDAAWEVLRGAVDLKTIHGEYVVLEEVDSSTAYISSRWFHPLGNTQSRLIVKRYIERDTRCVVVCRSIAEDDLLPLDTDYDVCNEVIWLVVEVDDDGVPLARLCQKIWLREGYLNGAAKGGVLPQYLMDTFADGTRAFENAIKSHIEKRMGGSCPAWSWATSSINFWRLASIIDMMASPRNSAGADLSQLPASTRHVRRQQEELAYLKAKIAELNGVLEVLMLNKEVEEAVRPPCRWKSLAQSERMRQQEALHENERLKLAVQEQVQFAESLAGLIRKKPRLCVYPTDPADQWKELRLVADPAARHAAFHAIADREYRMLTSAFIEAGLIDTAELPPCHEPRLHNDNTLEIQSKNAVFIPLRVEIDMELKVLTETLWDVLRGAMNVGEVRGTRVLLAHVDNCVSYTMTTRPFRCGTSQRRLIYKRYMESNPRRFVVVGRSIEDDEVHPIHQDVDVAKELMWITIELHEHALLLKYFHKTQPFRATKQIPPHLISEYLMDIHATFSGAEHDMLVSLGSSTQPQRSAYQRYMDRQQAEKTALRRQVKRLEEYLNALHVARQLKELTRPPSSEWQQLANEERWRMSESLLENQRLRAALRDHATAISAMTSAAPIDFTPEEQEILAIIQRPQRSAYQRYMDRQHAELAALRQQVTALEGRLYEFQCVGEARERRQPQCHWEGLARKERERLMTSVMENRRLKDAVKERAEHAQSLALLVAKPPRCFAVETPLGTNWKHLKLGTDPLQRYSAYHEMADRERRNLRSALLEAGLVATSQLPHEFSPRIFHDTLEVQARAAAKLAMPLQTAMDFEIISEVLWDIMSGTVLRPSPTGRREVLANVDESTVYITTKRQYSLSSAHRHVIVKRYTEGRRFVIVWRSIEDDELFPFDDAFDVSREVGWLVLEPQNGFFQFKTFAKIQPFRDARDCGPHVECRS